MFDALETNIKRLLKILIVRLAVICFSFLLIYIVKPDLFGSLFILVVPFVLLQVWLDQKFVIKKQALMVFWMVLFIVVSFFAGLYGVIGLVFFYLLYFGWRLYKVRRDDGFVFGVGLIKNCRKLGDDFIRGKNR